MNRPTHPPTQITVLVEKIIAKKRELEIGRCELETLERMYTDAMRPGAAGSTSACPTQ